MTLKRSYVINPNSDTRKENDYYPTPPIATECLLNKYGYLIPKQIWEPAVGRGWSKELKGNTIEWIDPNEIINKKLEQRFF